MSLLSLAGVGYRYGSGPKTLLDVTLKADRPQVIGIAGPNGAGKSTLLDIMAGQRMPVSGTCRVQGRDTHLTDRSELCRLIAHVPQQLPSDVPFTVEEVILTGRTPYGRGLYENDEDLGAAERAIQRTGLQAFRSRRFSSLSGGERQRVMLAAAICQQPSILLLDEPGAHLDPRNEAWLWTLVRELSAEGCLVVVVTHHLALAAQHCDRVCLLDQGRLVADGPPAQALRPDRLTEIFRVPFYRHDAADGRVFLSYGH
jgi:iron complex transport system ATP-binding protein